MNMNRVGAIAIAVVFSSECVLAQAPRGADTLSARAVADSQAVLRTLDDAVRANQKDAAAWFHRGMVAWALGARADAKPPIRGLDATRLRRLADTSLRIAVELEPKRVEFQLSAGMFFRLSPEASVRLAAVKFIDAAVAAARASNDKALLGRTTLEAGRIHWLRYDSDVGQMPLGVCQPPPSLDSARIIRPNPMDDVRVIYLPTEIALKMIHNGLQDCPRAASSVGGGDYERAEALFREAYGAAPADGRVFRHLAMLLAEKNRWRELASVARDRVIRQPDDGWAWLDLALAQHRAGSSDRGKAQFDTALVRLDPAERGRLFAFQRLLGRPDSTAYAKASTQARSEWERSFWTTADPLWSREGNDPRTEFLARITFAELRWTVDELGVRGADSDRGEAHIRYGPPDRIVATNGCNSPSLDPCAARVPRIDTTTLETHWGGPDRMTAFLPQRSDIVTYWDYDNGLTLVFWGAPTYGTAHFPLPDGPHIERAIELRPSAFDNVVAEKILEMPLGVTRFRAPGDSVDLLILAQAPVAAVREVTTNAVVRADTWLLGKNGAGDFRDSVTIGAAGVERGVYRVRPAQYLYRVEATAPGTMVAGRATRWITADRDTVTGFALHGFGMSDVLLATAAQPANRVPIRWRDFNVAPVLGAVPRRQTVEVIWENYELGARSGQTQYSVAITLQRQRSAAGRIAASIVGIAASAIGVDRTADRLTLKFDRAGPAAPGAFVDRVSIALGDTPAGDYRLTLEVTDKVSGRKATSASSITIAK